jgi:glycosyltransferase involved in cell wall biosynthesis
MEKVLIVSCVFPPEPVVTARVSYDIAKELSKSISVTVICPRPSRPLGYSFARISLKQDFERHELRSYICPKSNFLGRLIESYSFGVNVVKYIKQHRDEVSVIYIVAWPFFGKYLPLRIAHKYRIPTIVSVTDIYPESMTSRLGFIGRLVEPIMRKMDAAFLKKATTVVAISESIKYVLESSRKLSNVEVVRIWQEKKSISKKCESKSDKFIFMFVGSISPAANVPFIIKTFQSANLDAKLLIVGDGSDKAECVRLAKENRNIIFSSVTPDETPQIQSQADVLILTLRTGVGKTATPSKLPAYMFSAKPIIASMDIDSDASQIIQHANCGFVCEADDEQAFRNLLRKVYDISKAERDSMGDNGRLYAENHLSKEMNLSKITNMILQYARNYS